MSLREIRAQYIGGGWLNLLDVEREVYGVSIGDADYVKEETCTNDSLKRGCGVFCCSHCGVYLDIADMKWDGEDDSGGFFEPCFCPQCGRKVVR